MKPEPAAGASLIETRPWRTEGLFSFHFLTQRLPESAWWPTAAESDAVFDTARALLTANELGLRKGNEEDCEDRFVSPLLVALGFGISNRRRIPQVAQRFLPDYLLYGAQAVADEAFQVGTPDAYYASVLGLLEAKRWGHNLSEDASGRGKASKGRSPHQQIRDYLNESDRLAWGILTNGAKWRLYCKQDRSSSFFEFDLRAVLAGEDEAAARAEFRLFYALFRRAAFERGPDGRAALDAVRDGALQFREEVERRLREQVFECVEKLGRGFLDHRDNGLGRADLPAVYGQSLILLYRLLFVLNAEARGLLPTRPASERERAYFNRYGLELVRQKLAAPDSAAEYEGDDTFYLYERLRALFRLVNGQPEDDGRRDYNAELGIPRYNGGLFDPARYPELEKWRVADSYLAQVLALLSFRIEPNGARTAFDYASLGERHLGSIYEGLLEHRLMMTGAGPHDVGLVNDKGERKSLGAHYTPQPWVAHIVEHTLRPRLASLDARQRVALAAEGHDPDAPPADDRFAEAVIQLNVCDLAMGSGHFLVETVDLLADSIVAHPTTASRAALNEDGGPRLKTDGSGEPLYTEEAKLAYWKRRVAESCVYGVDVNPLAVELAKLSLWLKTVDRVPLNFLDHHLRTGNSLLGTWLARIPELAGPKGRAAPAKAKGKAKTLADGTVARQLPMLFAGDLSTALRRAITDIAAIEGVSTDTHAAAKEKERLWREISETLMQPFKNVADLWLAPWFGVSLHQDSYDIAIDQPDRAAALRAEHAAAMDELRAFHWELEFPDVFFGEDGQRRADAGFDAVVGNPPWERIKLQENEFFASRSPVIATAPRAADRKRLIAALPQTDPALWADYQVARDRAERELTFVQRSGLFPLLGRGDTNLYAVLTERALDLVAPHGRVGLLVPSGIATDHTTQHFFQMLVEQERLAELLDFENRNGIFEDVHRSFKFSILEMTGPHEPQPTVRCGYFLLGMDDLADPDRTFELAASDFRLFNPNTLTSPIFRRRRDYELTRAIYERVPVLVNKAEGEAGNPWGVRFTTMFHMTNDSHLFLTAAELEADGFWLGEGNVYSRGAERYVMLYEAKMIHQFDHRYASAIAGDEKLISTQASEVSLSGDKADPSYSPLARYWVPSTSVPEANQHFRIGYRDIARATDVRTCIGAILPTAGFGNTVALVQSDAPARLLAGLYANLCCLALDYVARQKVSSTHLNFFIVEQLPVLPPSTYAADFHGVPLAAFIGERVLELCYTAHDLAGFAADMAYAGAPFAWDEERRFHLRCQLDALFFHLYGLSRAEAGEVLDTFPIVRRQDEARWGRYRTRELVLGYWNAYAAGDVGAWVKG